MNSEPEEKPHTAAVVSFKYVAGTCRKPNQSQANRRRGEQRGHLINKTGSPPESFTLCRWVDTVSFLESWRKTETDIEEI